ncbi:amidohydrolase family protein [Nonomuraea sp. NPDC050536]|uniref:amidohydrolase family protein n=1 Tax=Nonomuraea sp. NPDC050536 TaxID=3364366 RepID=UPI0037C67669
MGDVVAAATTIVNAKVFDGTQSQDWTSVRFADGLITKCSATSAAQEGDEVIDAGGGTVLPGLIDAHVHLAPGALAQSLTFGVTTVLDMFSQPDLVAGAKEQAGSRPDVADVRSSGVGATAPGGHPSMMYPPFPTLTAAGQAEQFVAERIAEGSDYLKIISGTGGLWPSLDSETIKALVTAAHASGLVVVAHVSSTAGVEEVVSAGVDVLAHVPADAELDKALVERMAEAGIVVGPTLATIENTLGEPGGAAVAGDPRLAEALGDAWARRLTSGASGWRGREMPPYSRAEDNVRRLAERSPERGSRSSWTAQMWPPEATPWRTRQRPRDRVGDDDASCAWPMPVLRRWAAIRWRVRPACARTSGKPGATPTRSNSRDRRKLARWNRDEVRRLRASVEHDSRQTRQHRSRGAGCFIGGHL